MSYGWLSLLPPLLTIALAVLTRRIVVSLFAGVFIGALILQNGNLFTAVASLFEEHLWASLVNEDHLRVFAFTTLMGAMIGVIHHSGGLHAIVDRLSPLARTRRGAQIMTWFLGLIIFFDDYANTLLVGNTMRSLADRVRISREKLAYLVDSTAAPVAGLALISTWVAGEIGYIEAGFQDSSLALSVDGFSIFIQTIPFRFYVILAIVFVPLVGWMNRDFGPMYAAESHALINETKETHEFVKPNSKSWSIALVPILITILVTGCLLVATGLAAAEVDANENPIRRWAAVFGNGNSYVALLYGSLSGFAAASCLAWCQGALSAEQVKSAAWKGSTLVMPALVILWLAWALSGQTGDKYLGTGTYLSTLLSDKIDARFYPTIVFVLASVVAFATGTSWGTMGILMPLVIRVTVTALDGVETHVSTTDPLLLATIGSVLAGAIFGDHCSPISDTTVLSSQASGCDHLAHVWTQMPYAMVVGAVAIVLGTLPTGFGVNPWLCLLAGIIALAIVLRCVGRRVAE